MAARKLCTAGVRGPYSYVILENKDVAVAIVHDDEEEVRTTHLDIEVAERWVDQHLQTLLGRKYEAD